MLLYIFAVIVLSHTFQASVSSAAGCGIVYNNRTRKIKHFRLYLIPKSFQDLTRKENDVMLFSLFLTFFKTGLFTFGGGYAMIAQIKETVVEQKHWLTEDELLEIIMIAESTPGPIAINLATYVGYRRKGIWGSLCATLGVILPSLVIIYAISLFLDGFIKNKYVAYAFVGIKCAVAFLILKAGVEMLSKMEKKPLPVITFAAIFISMLLLEWFSVSFSSVLLILIGGIFGIFFYVLPGVKTKGRK